SREESTNRLPSENIPSLIDIKDEGIRSNSLQWRPRIYKFLDAKTSHANDEEDDETDDAFLSNLPTSVDDLQTKELHLKLERHYSSPIISRRQSPALYVGRSSIASERSYVFSSAHSVVSD